MVGMEIVTVNSTSKCLSRSFFLFLTVVVACLMIFSAVVHDGDDVETILKKLLAIVKLTVDGYGKKTGYNGRRGAPWISLKSAQKRRSMNLD